MMLVKYKSDNPVCPRYFSIHFCLIQHFFHFSSPDSTWVSSQLWKHFIGMLVILSSWSISQKCKIRICATARGSSSLFLFSFLYHPFICRRLLGSQMLWLRGSSLYRPSKSSGPLSTEKDSLKKIKILKKNSEISNNNLRRPTAMEEKNSAWSFGWRVSWSSEKDHNSSIF